MTFPQLSSSLRMTNLKLVGDAYSSIKISQLSVMVGMSEEEAEAESERRGWGLDRQGGDLDRTGSVHMYSAVLVYIIVSVRKLNFLQKLEFLSKLLPQKMFSPPGQ